MIKHLLRNLRQQPKGTRDNVALGIAVAVTSVVAMGWLYGFPMKTHIQTEVITGEEKPGFTALFSDIKNQLAGIGDIVTEQEISSTTRSGVISDYQIVMPSSATSSKSSFFTSLSTSTATSTVDNEAASSTATSTASSASRSIRIVTTNDIPTTSNYYEE